MKKFLMILASMLLVSAAAAQTTMKDVRSVTFYGVDFTATKIVGVEYRASDLIRAFGQINQAFMNEPNKYNPAKALKMSIERLNLSVVRERNLAIPYDNLAVVESSEPLTIEQIETIVSAYPEGTGFGAMIIAEELNATTSQARLNIVIFDRATHDVIFQRAAYAEAKGEGLRNYWGNAVYMLLKKWKF
ncbi:MAG: hypothetical protein II315_02870 [Rikenellaceae bacterium]|nr:hypothetical protein [Rikenellaceae bacterium]